MNISELLLLTIAPKKNPNRRTEQETVIMLFVRLALKLIITIGTTSKAPPEMASIELAIIQTRIEIDFAGLPLAQPKTSSCLCAAEYVTLRGSHLMSARPSLPDVGLGSGRVHYCSTKDSSGKTASASARSFWV